MSDESLRSRMRSTLNYAAEPRDDFVAELHDELAARLGFAPAAAAADSTASISRPRGARPAWLLLAATIALLLALLATLAAAGAFDDLLRRPDPILRQIQIDGQVRVALRPDRPQALSPTGTLEGFDIQVADDLATRLGVSAARNMLPVSEMLGADPVWQLGLPSQPVPTSQARNYIETIPYYYWPHYLAVRSDDKTAALADLTNQRVCVGDGSAAQGWASTETGIVVRTLESEDACEADVSTEGSRAFVTEGRLLADFASDATFRVVGEEPVVEEPRSMLVPRLRPGAGDFVAELDLLITDMRADGTLSELSRRWFGGQDLTRY